MNRRRPWPLLSLLAAVLPACSEETPTLAVPNLGTEYVLIAGAGGGRALEPQDVRVERAATVGSLEIPGNGNLDVDMLFAGLREEDLPAGLTPETLVFVSKLSSTPHRGLPPLFNPQVLEAPSPPGSENRFVAVFDDRAPPSSLEDRFSRFQRLVESLRIADPCKTVQWEPEFELQRIPADIVHPGRVLSSGDAYFGLSATSTAIIGRVPDDRSSLRIVGVSTGELPIQGSERADIIGVGRDEATDRSGQVLPATFTMIRGGILGHVALWSSETNAYLDVTPRDLPTAPGDIVDTRFIDLDGERALCTYGEVLRSCVFPLSGECRGGVWCKRSSAADWEVVADERGSGRIVSLVEREGLPLLALTISGSVYRYGSASSGWREAAVPAVNQGCSPFCAGFPHVAEPWSNEGDLLAVMAGNRGETLRVTGTSLETLEVSPIEAVSEILFGDERGRLPDDPSIASFDRDGALLTEDRQPLDFLVVALAPDGSAWFGTDRRVMIRVSEDSSKAERICLPGVAEGFVTAIAPRSNGDLIVAVSPPRIGITSWQGF